MTKRPQFLTMLAAEDQRAGASPRVEQALRARVRSKRSGLAAWVEGWRAWTAASATTAIAGLAVAAALMRPAPEARMPEIARFAPEAPEFAYRMPERAVPSFDEYGKPAVLSTARPVTRRGPVRGAPVQERQFYSLAYAPPELLASGRIVRVRVPRSALLSFGLPLDAYRPAAGKVDADVIFTEDGIARAIRFVSQ